MNSYDAARRLVQSVAPPPAPYLSGITTAYTYDPAGRVAATAETLDGVPLRTTSATYTPSGKLARTTDPNGNATRWTYDILDRKTSVTDALGRQTQYSYDRLSRVTAVSNPGLRASPPLLQQAWTLNGQRASLTDANINTTAFAYDGFDRLSTTTYPGGSTEGLTYDADSNVATRKTRAGATIAYGYDTLNRLTSKTPPSGPAVTYAYDRAGRLTGVSDTGAALVAAVPPGGAAVEYATAYGYDTLNRPTAASWSPTTAAVAPGAGSSVTFSHAYNAANQRSGQAVTDTAWLAYPAASPSTTGYTANSLNQYTAVGAVSPTYDGNGNLASDGTWTLGYDAENRLISASAIGTTATYAYDGRGRRKSRTVNGTTTVLVTDADNREVLEYDGGSGAILRWHAYGLGPNAVLGTMDLAAGTRTAAVPDMLGSVIGVMNAGTGALTPIGYLPYGGSTTGLGSLPGFAFTGQRVDRESGFYYYRARHYSTTWGRFMQTDPVGYSGDANLYAYVANDPLNAVDPSGEVANFAFGAAIGFGVDLVAQLAINGSYNWKQGLLATGAGAVTGGVSAFVGGTALSVGSKLAANAVLGGVANTAQTAALNAWEGKDASLTQAAIIGAGFGALGYLAGSGLDAAGAALARAQYNSASLADRLLALGLAQSNPIGKTPSVVTFATTLGNITSSSTSFISPDESGLSIIGAASAASAPRKK